MSSADARKAILEVLDQLPPLHQVAQKLIAAMNDDRSSARDLDKLIRNDQALTARVLKLANSSAYGKSRDIFQLAEAVVLLGHTTLTNMVLGVTVAEVIADSDGEFTNRAWEHSLDCAAVAQALAELTGCVAPENAFVAGLMHDIGLLIQAQAVPEIVDQVIASGPADPLAAEREAMGLNHAQVGMKLLDRWCLPVSLCEAVRFHHTPNRKYQRTNPLVNIVALADQLTLVVGTTPYPHRQGADIFQQLRLLGIEPDRFGHLFAALARSRENARCLRREVSEETAPSGAPAPDGAELPPVALIVADARRRTWYESVLKFMEIELLPGPASDADSAPESGAPTIIVDFHGATPTERGDLDRTVRALDAAPIVVGDSRHTPTGAIWQAAPHLPELFTREALAALLASPSPATAPSL